MLKSRKHTNIATIATATLLHYKTIQPKHVKSNNAHPENINYYSLSLTTFIFIPFTRFDFFHISFYSFFISVYKIVAHKNLNSICVVYATFLFSSTSTVYSAFVVFLLCCLSYTT